jgi:hypothetical protein
MKKLFLLGFLCLSLYGHAQPQFTVNNCFQVNDSTHLGFVIVAQNFADFIPQTGTNHTWDFSSTGTPGPWTTWTNPTIPYHFQPASQSIHSIFAASEINEYSLVAFPRDHFYSRSANQDTLYMDGLYTSTNYMFRPRLPFLTFPLDFADSVSTFTRQYANPNQPTNATGSVTRSWIYDGFGTVIFPYGQANNVYRIRTIQVDSNYVISSASTSEELIWFSQADGIPVLRFVNTGGLISAYYTSATGATAVDATRLEGDFLPYPNPFEDVIHLQRNASDKLEQATLYDAHGKRIVVTEGNASSLETQGLPAGLYIVEAKFVNGKVVRKKVAK